MIIQRVKTFLVEIELISEEKCLIVVGNIEITCIDFKHSMCGKLRERKRLSLEYSTRKDFTR